MASISGICSSSPSLKPQKTLFRANSTSLRKDSVTFPTRSQLISNRSLSLAPTHSVAREISAELSRTDGAAASKENKGLEKEPRALWQRYVDWLYQHKDLGLFLDVSRVGFTDEFVEEMEPRFQAAFRAMVELEKGAIANPDEGRMVGHYWLRSPKLAPNSFLRLQIENTLEAVLKFAGEVVSGKVSFEFRLVLLISFPFAAFEWQVLQKLKRIILSFVKLVHIKIFMITKCLCSRLVLSYYFSFLLSLEILKRYVFENIAD